MALELQVQFVTAGHASQFCNVYWVF